MSDVSCAVCTPILRWLDRSDIPRRRLTRGIDTTPRALASATGSIPWPVFLALCHRLEQLSPEPLRAVGAAIVRDLVASSPAPPGASVVGLYRDTLRPAIEEKLAPLEVSLEAHSAEQLTLTFSLPPLSEADLPPGSDDAADLEAARSGRLALFELCTGAAEAALGWLDREPARAASTIRESRAVCELTLSDDPQAEAPSSLFGWGHALAGATGVRALATTVLRELREGAGCLGAALWIDDPNELEGASEPLETQGETHGPPSRSLRLGAGGAAVGRLEVWDGDSAERSFPDAVEARLPWIGIALGGALAREATEPLPDEAATGSRLPGPQRLIQALRSSIPHLLCVMDADTLEVLHVDAASSIPMARSPHQRLREFLSERVEPGDRSQLEQHWNKIAEAPDNDLEIIEYRLRDSSGDLHWIRSFDCLIEADSPGESRRILSSGLDITQDRLVVEDQAERLRWLSGLVEGPGDALMELASDGRIQFSSPQIEALTGHRPAQLVGKSFVEFLLPEDRRTLLDGFAKVATSGEASLVVFRTRHVDGTIRWIESSSRALFEPDAAPRVINLLRDITERHDREAGLQELTTSQRSLLDHHPDVAFVATRAGEPVYCPGPPSATPTPVLAAIAARLQADDGGEFAQRWRESCQREERGCADLHVEVEPGVHRWFEARWRPFYDTEDEPRVGVALREVEGRHHARETLRAILESLGGTDEGFFPSLAQHIALALECDVGIVALQERSGGPLLETVGFWRDGAAADNYHYDALDRPCIHVLEGDECCYPEGLPQLFPRVDEYVRDSIESYVGAPLRDADGNVIGLVAGLGRRPLPQPELARSLLPVFADRAVAQLQREHEERSLRDRESRYRTFAERSNDLALELSSQHEIAYVSPNIETLLGYQEGQIVGTDPAKRVHRDDRATLQRRLEQVFETGEPGRVSVRVRHRDGGWRWLDASCSRYQTASGAQRIAAICSDVTDSRHSQQERAQLDALTEHSSDLIAVASLDGSVRKLNEAGRRLLGVEEDAAAQSLFELLAKGGADTMRYQILPAILRDRRWTGELVFLHCKTGKEIPVDATLFAVDDSGMDRPATIVALCRDLSEHKQRELELTESRKRYQMLAENPYDLISEIDGDGNFVYVSPNFRSVLGYAPEELLGRDAFHLVVSDQREAVRHSFQQAVEGEGTAFGSFQLRDRSGQSRWVDTTARAYRTASGRPLAVLISRDVTERSKAEQALRNAEARLRQSQKMDSIGRLAGGIAHDFNNLLTAITGYCDLLLDELGPQHPARADTEEILRASDRAAALTHQLLAFSREQMLQPRVIDLNTLVADIDRMLRRLVADDIELASSLEGELWPVKADPNQIQQVILNLVVNAKDAMPAGGRITIETSNREVTPDDPLLAEGLEVGSYATLAVRDAGRGIDPSTLSRVFEPFFTTKETGKGTGLGLSTVFGIARQSGGHVNAESQVDEGSCFTIYLPRVHEQPVIQDPRAELTHLRGSETVLLVEDSEQVRVVLRRYLIEHGYNVLEAASGMEALRLCSRGEEHIDLLLTDLVLPKMNGFEVARRVVEQRPDCRVLYMSGYSDESIDQHDVDLDDILLLEKPFHVSTLLTAIREIFDGRAV